MIISGIKIVTIILVSVFLITLKPKPKSRTEDPNVDKMRRYAAESTLFLQKNDKFPIRPRGRILLVGSGARNTMQGGWGRGHVENDFIVSCEEGLEKAGFSIVSKDWLDKYTSIKASKHPQFVKTVKSEADEVQGNVSYVSYGAIQPDVEHNLTLNYSADVCIYVIARSGTEGSDRRPDKGDVYLTNAEIADIQYLNEKFEKFLLVLNTCGVIDLTPALRSTNILLLSQLGNVTGDVLADIITGKVNPSGKLTATWSPANIYEYLQDFGDLDETKYKEGVYVGYRYFDSTEFVTPYFPFGHGLSYTVFKLNKYSISHNKGEFTIKVKVKNVGMFSGKEVVQVYITPSMNNKDKPYQSLVAFNKTATIKSKGFQIVTLKFNLEDIARYDEQSASFVLDNGNYIIRVGNSSNVTNVYGYINLKDDVVLEQLKNIGGKKPPFQDYVPKLTFKDDLNDVEEIKLTKDDFTTIKKNYDYKPQINEKVKNIPEKELAKICMGKNGEDGTKYIPKVFGAAGETVSLNDDPNKFLVLAEGPAGIRVAQKYGVDKDGPYRLCRNPIEDRLKDYISQEQFKKIDTLENNLDRKGEVFYQNATAIPIATALAQTFNLELVEEYGEIIAKDMEKFNIHLWLAPGVNIQRNCLNGRNFEYFSEDPLLSGKMAAAITRGVQKTKNKGVTYKHFTCNNQERNSLNSNSIVSERAMREIYLRAFQIAIKEETPYAIMTSNNLINWEHGSQRKDLLIDVLRNEWGFKGLIMSDWYYSNWTPIKFSENKPPNAVQNIIAGNNLQMPGHQYDYKIVMDAVKNGTVTKDHLLECASYVYDTIELLNK